MILPFNDKTPSIHPTAYVQASAYVIGDVVIGAESSVWFHAVIRGDVHYVRIGARTNVQDAVVIHVTTGEWPTEIGDDVTIGHRVVLHGCRIGSRCLIGIGAVVLDGAEIGNDCLIGAGSLVTPGTKIPAESFVLGTPARVVRPLTPAEKENLLRSAAHYVQLAKRYRDAGIA